MNGARHSRPARRFRRLRRLVGAAALLAAALPAPAAAPAPAERPAPVTDFDVIAAYLPVFLRYVIWSDDPAPADTPLRIGVLGRDPFGGALHRAVAGKKLGGRGLAVHHAGTPDRLAGCRVVFLNLATGEELAGALAALAGRPVLTVVYRGEWRPAAPSSGAAVELVRTGGNVRYRVDPAVLAAHGLRPTPGLLENALRPPPPPP